MKKGWKIFWIICAVLAAAGLLLAAAGAAMGGISILRGAGNLEIGITPGWLERIGYDEDDSRPDTAAESETYVPDGEDVMLYDGVKEIELDMGALAVCVRTGDTAGVQVDPSYLRSDIREAVENSIQCDDGGRELKIDIEKHALDWNTNDTGTLYITVPGQESLDSFSAEIGAGLLEIDGLYTHELTLDVQAGQITAENFETSYLEADCGAGQIDLSGSVWKEADIECGLGSIRCTLPGEQENYDYELSWGAGEVTVGNDVFSGIHREAEINNGSSRLIKADCGMGEINITFE